MRRRAEEVPRVQLVDRRRQLDDEGVLPHRVCRRHAERARGSRPPRLRQEGRFANRAGDLGACRQGSGGEALSRRHAGWIDLDLQSRRDRRDRVHAHHQCAGGGDPRRLEGRAEAGMGRKAVRTEAHASAVALLRSPRHRRRPRRAVHGVPFHASRRHAARDALRSFMATQEVTVPDIGDFKDVPVIQVFVKPGDEVKKEDPLVSLESDKATMDIPSPASGKVKEVKLKVGDRVSKGMAILVLEIAEAGATQAPAKKAETQEKGEPEKPAQPPAPRAAAPAPAAGPAYQGQVDVEGAMLVIGSGPGGYSAAFRAADLGMKTVLVERYPSLGGVCLNVGCIPSKALLHVARVIDEVEEVGHFGVAFGKPTLDVDKLRGWKETVVKKLTGGLVQLAKQRKVTVVTGVAQFLDAHHVEVTAGDKKQVVKFDQCIIAAGSRPVKLPFLPPDPRIIDSTRALELQGGPGKMLVVGGGVIGVGEGPG